MTAAALTEAQQKLRPFGSNLVVQESPVEETTSASGLVVPFGGEDVRAWMRAIVVAVGDATTAVSPGAVVYFDSRSAYEILGFWVVDSYDLIAFEAED